MAHNITAALPNCLILIWSPAGSRGFDDGVVVRGNAERARDIADRLHPAANEANASGPGGKPVARNELGGMIDVLGKIVEHQLVRLTLAEAILVKELSR